jgi:hypothetical protein
LKAIETDPSSFRPLKNVPADIADLGNLDGIRVAEIVHHKHSFRIIFATWLLSDNREHSDLLLAFPRKEGYEIDWEWVSEVLKAK